MVSGVKRYAVNGFTVTDFFTIDKHGNNLGFRGTREIIEGVGRSPKKIGSVKKLGHNNPM